MRTSIIIFFLITNILFSQELLLVFPEEYRDSINLVLTNPTFDGNINGWTKVVYPTFEYQSGGNGGEGLHIAKSTDLEVYFGSTDEIIIESGKNYRTTLEYTVISTGGNDTYLRMQINTGVVSGSNLGFGIQYLLKTAGYHVQVWEWTATGSGVCPISFYSPSGLSSRNHNIIIHSVFVKKE